MGTDARAAMRLLLCLAALQFALAGEADYTLDDSFWNEESPVGEVERLLREYRQNQELVRNIGAHYYQIIYPVQLRHHEKMGISTREVGAQKFPGRGGYGGADGSYQGGTRGRTRTGKHFHRTSLLIKAFNHKFRLDLELNTQLLAPNLMQKHFLPSGAEQVSKQEIEHCYYHGTVKDYPGASAAFHTCNGVSGVIHVGNETFVIHPFYGGDLSKHPHVIFEARTKANKGCANSGNLEKNYKNYRRTKHVSLVGDMTNPHLRYKRDVREATKYIETALVIDKAMFDKRNGSTRGEVVHDAIQVANIADLYFRTLNTRVSLVYIETWQGSNQAQIDKGADISRALLNFNDYTSRKLFKIDKDTTQLLTGESFQGGESGMAVPDTACTPKSVGISVDINTYEPHLLAGTMAHMIGHNIGMAHDDGREECVCRDWHGCIMAQTIVGLENVQPYKFSECSKTDYIDALRVGQGMCLLNKPNELEVRRSCGNGVVEEGEDCDCGPIDECHDRDPCCDPITCKLTKEAQCASGACCDNCQLKTRGVVCREAGNECDLPERCSGESGACPPDVHKKNGQPCGANTGYCFGGNCPTLSIQCEQIWGYGGVAGDKQCYDQFNSKGSINGHCGMDSANSYIKCDAENVRCGTLQCQMGNRYPVITGMDDYFTRTIISIKGVEFECKSTSGAAGHGEIPDHGLVRDGTPCGDNLVCVNQSCTSIYPYIDQSKCPSNHNNLECSGHGVCSNVNRCHCEPGWGGPDCSIVHEITQAPPTHWEPVTPAGADKPKNNDLDMKMEKKETPYGDKNKNKLSTVTMVFILVAVVKGVFICFALMAVCYRKSSSLKYDPPYVKKPIPKTFPGGSTGSNHSQEDLQTEGNKMLPSFNNMQPPFSRGDSQRVLFRHNNHMGPPTNPRYPDHMMQPLKRGVGSGSEEDPTHSGEEDTPAFIEIQPNSMQKLPEKGILKKQGGYGMVMSDVKEKWGDDSQSDNLEVMSQSDSNMGQDLIPGVGTISDVERTLKSLNGYHEDILEALRNAASHRGSNATPSGSSSMLSEEIIRKTLQGSYCYDKRSGSKENVDDGPQIHTVMMEGTSGMHHRHGPDDDEEDDVPPSCGPIRIRNLEDLIRQLEHHSSRHMSPSGSGDIRMSETEADRHYRIDTSAPCSESSQGSRCRTRTDEDPRFVYGRYRHPSQRGAIPAHVPHVPHVGHSGHGAHAPYPPHHALRAPSPHRGSHRAPPDEEGLYETADRERAADPHRMRDQPDSESDEFVQAQQQLARWASEEAVVPAGGPAGREYFPSPPSSSSGRDDQVTVVAARRPPSDSDDTAPSSSISGEQPAPARFPEYKH